MKEGKIFLKRSREYRERGYILVIRRENIKVLRGKGRKQEKNDEARRVYTGTKGKRYKSTEEWKYKDQRWRAIDYR